MARIVQRELASTSDGVAPSFIFNTYEVGKTYYNNGSRIDFVTYDGNLYVPTSEENIARTEDPVDSGFLLIVRKGKQGNQGLKGNPGRDGKTPSVFASFDGKQMRFFTDKLDENGNVEKDSNGNPVRKMIGQTNDLTGPSWRPKIIDNTIVWEKTRDDSQPESVNLSDFIQKTSPVLFRVNSDNTRRMDEMDESGPANYIQWKYEGDEYWNNLISISELMNLALAGICIDKDPNDGLDHLYHKQVLKAEYTATHDGKKIISDVEHGDCLYDAGPIPGKNYDLEIHQLTQDTCDLKRRVRNIENELPKFVKSVTVNGQKHRPDEDQNVTLPDYYSKEESDDKYQPKGNYQPAGDYAERSEIPSLDGYLKASDLKFRVVKDSSDDYRYLEVSMNGGTTYTRVFDATCACDHGDDPTPTEIPVTGVEITNCPGILTVGDHYQFGYNVYPENATNKDTIWTISDPTAADLIYDDVTHLWEIIAKKAANNISVTVTTVDGNYTDSCTFNIQDKLYWITVDPDVIYIDSTGGNGVSIVETNADEFEVNKNECDGCDCSWVNVTKQDDKVYVNVTEVNPSQYIRQCQLNVTAENAIRNIDILQYGTPEEIDDRYLIVPEVVYFNNDGGNKTFEVDTNCDQISVKSIEYQGGQTTNWLSIVSINNNVITVRATSSAEIGRTAAIVLEANKSGGELEPLTEQVIVVQTGSGSDIMLAVNPTTITIPATQIEQSYVTVSTNASDFNVRTNNCDWYSLNKATSGKVFITAEDNTSTESRQCDFYVTAGDKEVTVTVRQNGTSSPEDTLELSLNPLNFTASGGNKNVIVTTNVSSYTVESPSCNWITITNSGNTVTVTVTANTGTERYCDISVSAGDQEKTLRVTQEAGEVTPTTKYKVSIGNTCDASTAYLTKTEGGSSIGQTYQAEEDEIVWLHAEKSGKKDINKPSGMIKNNYPFVIACDEWKDEGTPCTIENITLNPTSLNLTVGDERQQITANVVTSGDCDSTQITWSSNNENVATVDNNGKVTAVAAGTATITAKVGTNGPTADCSVTVNSVEPLPNINITVTNSTRTNTVVYAMAGTSYDEGEALDNNIVYNGNRNFTITPVGSLYVYGFADQDNQPVKCTLSGRTYTKPYNVNYIEIPYNDFAGTTNEVIVTLV